MDRFESILDESISALQAGVPIEEILAEAPDYAQELRPLLYAAMVLADPNPSLVPEERKESLRTQYLAQAAALPPLSPPTIGDKMQAVFRIMQRRLTRGALFNDLVTVSLTVMLTLIMTALIISFAARDSIPGDLLYSAKRISENIRLSVTFDDQQHLELENTLNRERIAEIEQLIQLDRAAVVQFKGVLDTKGETLWVIEGLTVFLPEGGLVIQGDPQEGDMVEVVGFLRTNKVLIADAITKEVSSP
ncbi:MAG: hypothetical protein KDI79_18820 [Anaerolineae bacterium]|nr:hypothetical protein [Anaerolineae bacterium]